MASTTAPMDVEPPHPADPLETLPEPVLQLCLEFLDARAVVHAAAAGPILLRAAQQPSLWSALARVAFARSQPLAGEGRHGTFAARIFHR